MHNAAFSAVGLNWAYLAFAVDDDRVADALTGLAAAGCAGLNVRSRTSRRSWPSVRRSQMPRRQSALQTH